MKIVASADWQLDSRSPSLGPEWLDEQEKVCKQIAALAWDESADAIVLAGDLFERKWPTLRELHAFQRIIDAFPPVPILAIPGNGRHDGNYYGQEIALGLFPKLAVHRTPGIEEVGGVSFCTLPWMSDSWFVAQQGGRSETMYREQADHLVRVAQHLRETARFPAVLVAHWKVEGAAYPTGLPVDDAQEPVLPLDALEDQGWDAIVLGDIHAPQWVNARGGWSRGAMPQPPEAWPLPFFYVGSPMPLNHGEAGCDHGAWLLEGPPFTARFVPLDSRRFLTVDLPPVCVAALTNGGSVLFAGDEEDGFTEADDVTAAIVRVRYSCTEEQARRIDQAAIKRALLDAGAWRVDVRAEITRAERARVQAMTVDLDETAALGLWLDEQGVTDREPLLALHALYLGEARA